MAEILNTKGANVANPPMIRVNKGFESLVITTDVKYSALANETIAISIQRKSGNIDVFKTGSITIKKLMQLVANGQSAISYNADGLLVVVVDLTPMGNIPLGQNEEIQITLTGLAAAKSWYLNTIEAPYDAVELYQYSKIVLAPSTQKDDFDVSNTDVILLEKSTVIKDIRLSYTDPRFKQTVHTLNEIEATTLQADCIAYIDELGAVKTGFADGIVLGLQGVSIIEINKNTSDAFVFYTREIL